MKDRLAALRTVLQTTAADAVASVSINMEAQTATASVNGNGDASQALPDRNSLNEFLTQCNVMQASIASMNADVDKLRTKHNAILFTPDLDTQQTEKQRNEADELYAKIRENAALIRTKVKALEAQIRQDQNKIREKDTASGKRVSDRYRPTSANGDANAAANSVDVDPTNQSAEMRIKVAQYSTVNHQFYEAYRLFNDEQRDYSEKCRDRLTKQIRIVDPKADDDKVTTMLEGGGDIFSSNLLAETTEARRHLADIEARHNELINLERSIRELHDMFVDIEMFVNEQGEVIDRIESNVEKAADFVEVGTEELNKAVNYKRAACKKKICIIGIVAAVVVVIVIIIVLSITI